MVIVKKKTSLFSSVSVVATSRFASRYDAVDSFRRLVAAAAAFGANHFMVFFFYIINRWQFVTSKTPKGEGGRGRVCSLVRCSSSGSNDLAKSPAK